MVYMTGKQKASVLLSLLGKDTASTILQQLDSPMSEYLTSGFATPPTQEQVALVLNELRSLPSPSSTDELALSDIPMKKAPTPEDLTNLSELVKYDSLPVISLLKSERQQVITFLLSNIDESSQELVAPKLVGRSDQISLRFKLPIMEKIFTSLEKVIVHKLTSDEAD